MIVMGSRKATVLIIMAALLLATVLIYYDARLINNARQAAQEPQNTQTADSKTDSLAGNTEGTVAGSSFENTVYGTSQATTGDMELNMLIKDEAVIVDGNTPEFELELKLAENTDKKTFLRLQYYLKGISVINELDNGELPELTGIFDNRDKERGNTEAFRIGQALLNPVHSQLYLRIHGAPLGAYTQASLYMVELNDMSVKKLFSYPGKYGKMALNKDFSLLVYSFGDPPHLSNLKEDNLVEVFDCADREYIIKGNRDKTGNVLGKNSSPEYLYDYEFLAWRTVDVLKLRQAARLKNDADSDMTQIEVLYDIQKNLLFNHDGSELKQTAAGGVSVTPGSPDRPGADISDTNAVMAGTGSAIVADTNTQGKTAGSEAENVIKSFYSYLAAENDYSKALQLMDDNFKLRLNILKQSGVDEISKRDISAEGVSLYSNLLKAAKLDTITKSEMKGGICKVTYYQILGLSADSQIRQLMSAQLKKTGNVWKIIIIEDGVQ